MHALALQPFAGERKGCDSHSLTFSKTTSGPRCEKPVLEFSVVIEKHCSDVCSSGCHEFPHDLPVIQKKVAMRRNVNVIADGKAFETSYPDEALLK